MKLFASLPRLYDLMRHYFSFVRSCINAWVPLPDPSIVLKLRQARAKFAKNFRFQILIDELGK
ncbi:MAG: hypothetical protein DME50_08385 [Verrucomicrobia bacterium]|nr:MAG: hypothetical protein DME50_08385 [Verrucomicrobiota bacterium]